MRNGKPDLSGFVCRCLDPDRVTESFTAGAQTGTVRIAETSPRSRSPRIALCTQLSCPFQPGNRTYCEPESSVWGDLSAPLLASGQS